jgi:tetratricopeptide (TPR) repeat protein
VCIRNGQKNKGIDHLKQSLKLDPNNCDVLTKLGEVLMREQDALDEAEEYLKRAIAIDENMPDALVALGRVFEKKGEID